MRPILFDEDATSFETFGIGELTDAVSCMVNEGINDVYELEMTYPVNGAYFSEIQNGRIIAVKVRPGNTIADKKRQGFRIYSISKPISGEVTVNARHVSYDLSGWIVRAMNTGTCGYGLTAYINYINSHVMVSSGKTFPFSITSEIEDIWTEETEDNRFTVAMPVSIRSLMGTDEGSIVAKFGGEWKYDNFNCTLVEALGYDNGVKVEYGINLIDLTQEENIEDAYSGIYPFYGEQGTAGAGYSSSRIWDLQYKQDYSQRVPWRPDQEAHADDTPYIFAPPFLLFSDVPFPKILPVNLSEKLKNRYPETAVQLIEKANEYVEEEKPGVPKISLSISFVNWGDILGEDFFTEVNLGDVLHVYFEKLGVMVDDSRCIATSFDVLLDRFDSYTIGDSTDDLSDNIIKKTTEATLIGKKAAQTAADAAADAAQAISTSESASADAGEAVLVAASASDDAEDATRLARQAMGIANQAIATIEYDSTTEMITFKKGSQS